jgi:probable rRNA maturation factor
MEDEPPLQITVTHLAETQTVAESRIRTAVEATLRRQGVTAAGINVAVVDDKVMARLNKAYLGCDGTTDVLAFDLRDDPEEGKRIDGELVVSIDTAAREASERGHTVDAELALYVAHGVLHLLGFKDDQPETAARMHELEDEILSSIGVGPVFGSSGD